ncbi:histidine phosphatase family protein [Solibacillus sp. R5-41]|uniref:histidine phosphatase family protein n=1 Tax=Solibacillus sp. R5-41 TaxID=2048654 RepID=UPI000C126AB8|nr:histidine phosphatase family protein [Solibacillus sp. R5-41]ATP40930.1 histidine phosphatase family protein [Solibacillus sp. R5-41]
MKKLYVIRHCEAEGQNPEAALTEKGYKQAIELKNFFCDKKIERIITSPYQRAIESIQPLAKTLNIEIEHDNRLSERVLSNTVLSDWLEKLELTFQDFELKFEGGESSSEAKKRILELVEQIQDEEFNHIILVTHGNLMSLLLNHFNNDFGFNEWKNLSNPDIYVLEFPKNKAIYKRIWKPLM